MNGKLVIISKNNFENNKKYIMIIIRSEDINIKYKINNISSLDELIKEKPVKIKQMKSKNFDDGDITIGNFNGDIYKNISESENFSFITNLMEGTFRIYRDGKKREQMYIVKL
jgi:hypothetical protein